MDIQKMFLGLSVLSALAGLAFAGGQATAVVQIGSGLCVIYNISTMILSVVVFVLVVAAAVVYAGGQIMGAETRARASVWATSMIIGAIIGLVLYLILPVAIEAMMGSAVTAGGIQAICATVTT